MPLVRNLGFSSPSQPKLSPRIPPSPLRVPGTQRHGTPRSPSAPRPAPPGHRAPTPSHAGHTSTPSCSRRLRRPVQSPPRARRCPPLPYWGEGEKTAASALRPKCWLRAAPSAPVPRVARGLNPGALQLLPRRRRPSSPKREDHPGTDSNELLPEHHVTSAARRSQGGGGARRAPRRVGTGACCRPRESRSSNRGLSRRPELWRRRKRGRQRLEEAGRTPRAGAGLWPASFVLAKLEGSAGLRGRLRSGGATQYLRRQRQYQELQGWRPDDYFLTSERVPPRYSLNPACTASSSRRCFSCAFCGRVA